MTPQAAWNAAYNQLEIQLDRATFETWLRDADFLSFEDGVFVIGVPNAFARDMLTHRMYRSIRRVVSDAFGQAIELRFEIHKPTHKAVSAQDEDMPLFRLLAQQSSQNLETGSVPLHSVIGRPERPLLPESQLNQRYIFDRYIVSAANQIAYQAAQAIVESPGSAYNPLFVYGGVGTGKTHLLQAIAHACVTRGLRAIYVPSEAFTNDLIDAIRNRTTAMFRERYRTLDVLLVDDIQFIGGKESTQEEFFHTFNALYTFNKQVVVASDRPPSELTLLEDRLRSRFSGGLVTDLQPLPIEARVAILDLWAEEHGVVLPPNVKYTLAEGAPRSIRDMEGIFNSIVAQMRVNRQPITVETADETLQQFRRPGSDITVKQVIQITAEYFGLRERDLLGQRRTSCVSHARQVAMYLAREMTTDSLIQIGVEFGGRKHTTVLHSCNKVIELLEINAFVRQDIEEIKRQVLGGLR